MAKTLVIMAAGLGSRFGGDKQITGIGPSGEILLEYSVFDAIYAGFDKIVFVIRPGMENFFLTLINRIKKTNSDKTFCISLQGDKNSFDGVALPSGRTKPLGTVHAVLSAREHLTSHFAVINADDYYGRNAFCELIAAIESFEEPREAALVSYELKNTLSPHGTVTRGLCQVDKGKLLGIREAYKVGQSETGEIIELDCNGITVLSPETPVSMNMWAFSIGCIPFMEDYLDDFLDRLEADDNKSECLLPVMISDLLNAGILRVSVHATYERWFGLTYRRDAEDAAWELDKRHQDGHYPSVLF